MWRFALLCVCLVLLAACAPTLKMEQHIGDLQVKDKELPRQVAILPFANETGEPGIDSLVRRTFANHFTAKNYQDMKLPIVDEKVVHFEKASGKKAAEATPAELAAATGCDGLVYGRVIDYKRIFAAVYSQFGVEAEVWMINAKTGKEIFRFKESVRYHEGGVPTSVLSAVITVISTAMNLRDIQKVRLVNELSYKLTGKIPSPKSLAANARPEIREVLTNAVDGPFGVRKVFKVGLEGEPGLVATFDIGTFRKGVPMKEIKPGVYVGEYPIIPGDNVRDMPVIVTLTRPGGNETQWLDGSGYVTIDTTPPPSVTGVKAKGFPDRVQLSWSGAKEVSDLKGYRVLRSDQPLNGYKELAVVEVPKYEDSTAVPGVSRYYRIVAIDQAGNESEPTAGVAATTIAAGPVPLSGEIREDRILAGVYQVKDKVIVPRGVTLTASPGTRFLFDQGAGVVVAGALVARGDEDGAVEFLPAGKERWQGISLENGRVELAKVRIRGAETALALKDTHGFIEEAEVLENGSGIAVTGVTGLEIRGCTVSANKVGISLTGTDTVLANNSVVQNGTGVTITAFTGAIRDNNIFGNERNMAAVAPVNIGPNYFGSVNLEEMRIAGATPAQVYDARIPGGKAVASAVNPYAVMSADERQKKGTELVIEAGNYFRSRNYGKAVSLFEESLRAAPTVEIYYYLALCYQEMQENGRAMDALKQGVEKFPRDALLWKSLGLLLYEKGAAVEAKKALEEVLRLSPDDRQARFVLERVSEVKKP